MVVDPHPRSVYHEPVLSYRHAFHAGNAADVLKHSVLSFCLEYFCRKEKPFLCIDTHAGAGYYALDRGYADQNREWEEGAARIWGFRRDREVEEPPLLARYRKLMVGVIPEPGKQAAPYPGSPAIIRHSLRPQDQGVCFELHPADFDLLRECLGEDPRFRLFREDGFQGLRSLLPPPSRRGLIFIDPPYELASDYQRVPEWLAQGIKRFPTGTYIIWYPLLGGAEAEACEVLRERLIALYQGNRCLIELCRESPPRIQKRGLWGSGLAIYNPPWTLKAALEESLPILANLLDLRRFSLRWEPERRQGATP